MEETKIQDLGFFAKIAQLNERLKGQNSPGTTLLGPTALGPSAPCAQCPTLCHTYEQRLFALQNQVLDEDRASRVRVDGLKEDLGKIQHSSEATELKIDSLVKRHADELKEIERSVSSEVQLQRGKISENELTLLKDVQESLLKVKQHSAKTVGETIQNIDLKRRLLKEDIDRMREQLRQQTHSKALLQEDLAKTVTQSITQLEKRLNEERRERKECQEQLERRVIRLGERLRREVASERRQREEGEELVLKLIEKTCERIESNLRRKMI